ncbi:hypothetical protein BV22DRAFT_1154520 [Leucogyrophana mollusca]|uniref:Uncharacterized protein n=1 Tax=Leucogyrophana mollusca TaxID=85980 RepID=A0ACB8BPT9_9AGAM|nr:hypothetical protein BV22DRAFT_1154520 [Leucogyrophana mollusca]
MLSSTPPTSVWRSRMGGEQDVGSADGVVSYRVPGVGGLDRGSAFCEMLEMLAPAPDKYLAVTPAAAAVIRRDRYLESWQRPRHWCFKLTKRGLKVKLLVAEVKQTRNGAVGNRCTIALCMSLTAQARQARGTAFSAQYP